MNLSGNNLSGTIPVLSGLTWLTGFNLSGNKLSTITSDAFSGLIALQTLTLTNNRLSLLPSSLSSLTNLTSLNVNTNKICTGVIDSSLLTFVNTKVGNVTWQTTQNNSACPTPTDNIVTIPATTNTSTISNEFVAKGYQNGNGALQAVDPGTYVGTNRIRTEFSDGKVLVPFVMQSTGSTGKIEIVST